MNCEEIKGCTGALCELISSNRSITSLDVSGLAFNEPGSVLAVGEALARNTTLRSLVVAQIRRDAAALPIPALSSRCD